MNCEAVLLRQREARTSTKRLRKSRSVTAFQRATSCSMATLWRIQRHVLPPGASPRSKVCLSGGKSAPGIVEGKVSSETSLSAFQSVAEKPSGAFAIVGARLCFSETLRAPKRVFHALGGKPCFPARAPRLDWCTLELGVTPRTKRRRRRAPCKFLRQKVAAGFPTAPLTLSSREPGV